MSDYQWIIGAIGLLVTVGLNLFYSGKWVGSSTEETKAYIDKKVSDECLIRTNAIAELKQQSAKALLDAVTEREAEMERLRREWADSQKSQDNTFGEVGLSLRRALETVEKEMHTIELWNRDNYVKIPDFEKALERVSSEIKSLSSDIKKDLRDLKSELIARP